MSRTPKGRDWSAWKNRLQGRERLEEQLKKAGRHTRVQQYHQETRTAIALPEDFSDEPEKSAKKIPVWLIVLCAFLLVKKCHHAFFPNIKEPQEIRRAYSR